MGEVVAAASWYMRWRTTIWSTVFFVAGLFGGNADRIVEKIPTLQYGQPEIQKKEDTINQQLDAVQEKIKKLQNDLDKLAS